MDIYVYFWDWEPTNHITYHLTRLSKRDGVICWEEVNCNNTKEVGIPLLGPVVNWAWQEVPGYPKFRIWRLKYPRLSNYFFSFQLILSLIIMTIIFVPAIIVTCLFDRFDKIVYKVKKYCRWNSSK